ncbi:MAG: GNAT family N-acetyltransferase [Blastocatellia bacterium]|nr:GNAT family N-acetyltransferase [Blastocatellia bacterium]
MIHEWRRGEYLISTDRSRLDVGAIHQYLTRSYWAEGIPLHIVERSIEHSFPFGLYRGERQIGFARVISDYATYAYLADVFVLEEFQRQGLGKWMVEIIVSHPSLEGLRRWSLITRDAHDLYRRVGFVDLKRPEMQMEMVFTDIYKKAARPPDERSE